MSSLVPILQGTAAWAEKIPGHRGSAWLCYPGAAAWSDRLPHLKPPTDVQTAGVSLASDLFSSFPLCHHPFPTPGSLAQGEACAEEAHVGRDLSHWVGLSPSTWGPSLTPSKVAPVSCEATFDSLRLYCFRPGVHQICDLPIHVITNCLYL